MRAAGAGAGQLLPAAAPGRRQRPRQREQASLQGAAVAAARARKEPWQPTDPSSLLEMAGEITEPGKLYSPYVGLVYMFNLIVGTGALTMPKAFAAAGWLVSLVLLVFLGFMSFVTTTFVVEAMAAANAQLRWKRMETHQEEEDDGSSTASDSDVLTQDNDARAEKRPILSVQRHGSPNLFEITDRVEMGQMASMFFNKVGVNLFYFCIIIYLYGDLAIYAAAVPFSLMQVTCSAVGNDSCGVEAEAKYNDTDPCWGPLHRVDAYRIYLGRPASFAPQAPSVPSPGECQREVLGGQRDSPSAEASSLPAGAASTAYRWTGAAAAPAAQQAPAGQSRARRWQSGAHPGWRPSRKLAAWGRGPLVGCFETGQGHPGLPCCLEHRSCEVHLRGLGLSWERGAAWQVTCHPLPDRGASPCRHPLKKQGMCWGLQGGFCLLNSLPKGAGQSDSGSG
ncbi:transmembrane protein 104 isoform X3 [Lagenorhynchus albirostris]|uniref:transmembrane protein 104 isoform X3 n=1 Tax=Lagenorhynchus albirostris TaxID=27610 RepID=UPI0028E777DB|nr:transmembrane protein 104 isoform X3 [Lagenorhynchus albirostris]